MGESELGKHPKCDGKVIKGSNGNLGRNFACTRSELKSPEELRAGSAQSCNCEDCGHMGFYKEPREGVRL